MLIFQLAHLIKLEQIHKYESSDYQVELAYGLLDKQMTNNLQSY